MDIRSKVISALRWSAASRFLGQLVSWAITVYVIRLLDPGDYGLMAMAMVVISFLILLNTAGLDTVLVQEKSLDEQTRRQVFGLVIILNGLFFLLVFFGAGPLAALYGEPRLVPVLQVLSFQFLFLVFETLPQSQLEREIEFSRRSVVDFATLVIGSLTTLLLAVAGYGVWALVWGTLVTTLTRMLGLNLICPALVLPSFSLGGMRQHFSFGGFVTLDRGLWYLYSESDKFVGGKLLGNQALGYYAVASQLASLPMHKIGGLLNSVAFPAFSQANASTDAATVRGYLLKATHLLAIAAFPVFLGISSVAQPLVAGLLGEKWLPAAPLLAVIGLVMPFRLLSNVFPPLLWGLGHPRASAVNLLLASAFMPAAFYVGTHWGVLGLAYAWLAMYPVVFLFTAYRSCRVAGVALAEYARQLRAPALAGALMYAAVMAVEAGLGIGVSAWLQLFFMILTGIAAYLGVLWLIDRPGLAEMQRLIRS